MGSLLMYIFFYAALDVPAVCVQRTYSGLVLSWSHTSTALLGKLSQYLSPIPNCALLKVIPPLCAVSLSCRASPSLLYAFPHPIYLGAHEPSQNVNAGIVGRRPLALRASVPTQLPGQWTSEGCYTYVSALTHCSHLLTLHTQR